MRKAGEWMRETLNVLYISHRDLMKNTGIGKSTLLKCFAGEANLKFIHVIRIVYGMKDIMGEEGIDELKRELHNAVDSICEFIKDKDKNKQGS